MAVSAPRASMLHHSVVNAALQLRRAAIWRMASPEKQQGGLSHGRRIQESTRLLSTSGLKAQSPSSSSPSSSSAEKIPSKHRLFYRELLPPIFKVLAYSTAVYFSLHLAWTLLDRDEQRAAQAKEIQGLEEEARAAAANVKRTLESKGEQAKEQSKSKSWWNKLTGR
ncbi:hypothetical protein K437DRAFT_258340 [Tilletiaria anomala UBC 951]|uniref:Uncharacterized protein n=1 Tax=Tilletiaria anomala (strain ATCC 24038 / CBS 436.72 / UBC 951) TaxID=1037660 RepID=A0A066VIA5_TILAU|nr:uncharacterized protein K437DRAFT_258340 [Tilletiaria anomala UBC 951]KDN41231.1 hypothetical protein K437DRAFT_258340 [Tilletiaria anomala UBC 951]